MSIVYHNLNRQRKEIRLLQLYPAQDPKQARIPTCRLIQGCALGTSRYTALSYAWGNPERNRIIVVDDLPIRIPQNLFDALIGLRPRNEPPIMIWIDFLCIDQENDEEKSWQVGLMKDIYSRAEEVLAWLGPGDAETERTIKYLDIFGKKAEACEFHVNTHVADIVWSALANKGSPSMREPRPFESRADMSEWFQRALGLRHENQLTDLFHTISGWHSKANLLPVPGMKSLFERAWWGRVWVLQEIAVSERAEFICGSVRISRCRLCAAFNAFAAFRALLNDRMAATGDDLSLKKYHTEIMINLFHYRPLIMTNAWRIHQVGQFTLICLLHLTCVGSINLQRHGPHNLECGDPRDRIFALLGIASDREELQRKGVYPDYRKSCQEVYTLATAVMLQQGHLTLLSLVQYPKIQNSLPSWVPDWSRSATNPLQTPKDDHITMEPEFHASGNIRGFQHIVFNMQDSDIQTLSLSGYVYDDIYEIGSFPRRQSSKEVPILETFSWPREWLVEILRLTYQTKHNFPTFDERLQAVARTLVGGVVFVGSQQTARVGDSRFDEAAFLLRRSMNLIKDRYIKSEAQEFLANKELQKKFQRMSQENTLLPARIQNEIIGKSLGRLPFITSKGHLGLSQEYIRKGDHVVIIRGAQVPYILRQKPRRAYRLVSEAYVDGIMDGEVAQDSNFTKVDIM
ncbi:HET-domain-containing protein [Whalleya microplaca]|nr:HET-domain-containing protein [Whalleya microplaca]